MKTVLSILKQIEQTSSRNDKELILKQNKDNNLLITVLEYTYNPYKVFGIGKKAFRKVKTNGTQQVYSNIIDLLDYLLQHNTGSDIDKFEVNKFLAQFDEETQEWYKRIIQKDLKIGITEKTINKVFPNLIPVFNVMLAEPFERLFKRVVVEPKMDGVRATGVKINGNTTLFTRNGKQIDGFNDVIEELNNLSVDNCVFDGELMGKDYKDTMTKVFRKSEDKTSNYHIFDIITIEEFKEGKSREPLVTRKAALKNILEGLNTKFLIYVEEMATLENPTIEQMNELTKKAIAQGYEGTMVKNADSYYQCKRSYDWQKAKEFFSDEFTIVGFEEGEGKYKNTLGKVIIDVDGVKVGVGSGFTDVERKDIWDNKNQYLGMQIEVQYQEKIAKTGSLRFPTVKSIRYDK